MALLALIAAAMTIRSAMRQPWLSEVVPTGGTLIAVDAIALVSSDRVEDPDVFDQARAADAFYARQTRLAAALRAHPALTVRTPDGSMRTVTRALFPSRPLAALPPTFWVQLAVGVLSFLISAWVLVVSPRSAAARLFAIYGAALLVSALPAATCSTRELARRIFRPYRWRGPLAAGSRVRGAAAAHPARQ